MPESPVFGDVPACCMTLSDQWEFDVAQYTRDEIATVVEFLDTVPDSSLLGCDVLEIVSSPFRAMLREHMSRYRVIADDRDSRVLDMPVQRLEEQRSYAVRVEEGSARTRHHDARIKAVCMLSASISSLAPNERPHVIRRAVGYLPPGGALIVSVDHVLPQAPETRAMRIHSGTELIDEFKHRDRRWRRILRRRWEEVVLDLHLVTPEDLVRDIYAAGLIVVMQHSTPDPDQPSHVRAVLGAINRATQARP